MIDMKNLQQSNGLYWHHGDLSHQFWGRGNGWGAASSAEMMQELPQDHAKYNDALAAYKKHMKGLIDVQLTSGMWPQLLGSTDSRNWEESSGTAMFIFALFTGLALTAHLGSDGKLKDIAAGFWPSVGDANEYLNASRAAAGNSHGTAGFLWAATAIVRYYSSLTHTIAGMPFSTFRLQQEVLNGIPLQHTIFYDLQGRTLSATEFYGKIIIPSSRVIRYGQTQKKGLMIIR